MKIYIKSLLKLIKTNLSRFITLILIVFLGIGFLVGIFGVAPDLQKTVAVYFHENNVSELYVTSTTGLFTNDIENIEEVYASLNPQIRTTYETDEYIEVNNLTRVGHLVYTDLASNKTDKLTLISGGWPSAPDEVVVERSGNYLMDIQPDSKILIGDDEYIVSGVVANPWYMMKERYDSETLNASLDTIVYLPIDYYLATIPTNQSVLYTHAYLYFGLDEDIFSSGFKNEVEKLQTIFQNSDFASQHNANLKEYLLEVAINDGAYDKAFLSFIKGLYDSSLGFILTSQLGDYAEVETKYYAGEEMTIPYSITFSQALVQENFANKSGEIYDLKIDSYLENVPEGTTLGLYIDDNITDSIDTEYADLTKEIYYLDSLDNYSTYFFEMNVEKVEDVAIIFPIFFFIIASLVALTSLRRLVFEERVTMGTLRALGYSKVAVLFRYIIYGVIASAIGSLLGICLGIALIPYVVYNIFNSTCHMPPLAIVYDTPFISAVILGMILVIILVVIISVYGTLKETPANLLIPKAPKPGRRIFLEKIGFIWRRLSFKYKSSIRNMIRYKRNLIMMIIGVGGCTALLLLAFGLQDSMDAVSNREYNQIILYDAMAVPNQDVEKLDAAAITHQDPIFYDTFAIDDYTVKVIGADAKINEYFGFYVKNKKYEFTSNDVLVSQMLADVYKLKVGSNIRYAGNDYVITGIFENYIDNYLFIGNNVAEFNANRIIFDYENISERDLTESLLDTNQIVSVEYVASVRTAYNSLINNIILIVAVLIIFAAVLAVVVIFNLLNINVSERKRELATLKVLGYKNIEVHGYMARESFTLTIIGMLIGLGIGVLLHQIVANIIDTNTLMAGRYIKWQSYLYSILLTMSFAIIVDLSFIPYYRKISMTDSLKAIE